jgi:hypothetical protein
MVEDQVQHWAAAEARLRVDGGAAPTMLAAKRLTGGPTIRNADHHAGDP